MSIGGTSLRLVWAVHLLAPLLFPQVLAMPEECAKTFSVMSHEEQHALLSQMAYYEKKQVLAALPADHLGGRLQHMSHKMSGSSPDVRLFDRWQLEDRKMIRAQDHLTTWLKGVSYLWWCLLRLTLAMSGRCCLALRFMLAMLAITVLNLGYIVSISYYCHYRSKMMLNPPLKLLEPMNCFFVAAFRWLCFRLWNVMGLVLTFLHQAPFWDDDEFNANLSASGNFVLNDHDYWWIQPLTFGVQAVQAEAYHMDGYQQTLHFDKF